MFLRMLQSASTHWPLLSLFIYLLFLPCLSGCAAATTPPLEPVTITFAYPEVDTAYYESLVQEFNEQYPHITVELHPLPWDRLRDAEADVLPVSMFNAVGRGEQDDILGLNAFIEQDQAFDLPDFYPDAIELFTNQGETWAIPYGMDMAVMYYNKDLFDQNNIPYPENRWTWVDFLNAAMAINDPEAGIYGYTVSTGVDSPDYDDAWLFVYQHGGRIVDDLQNPTRATFDDPLTVEALEWYAKLYYEYGVAPTAQQARRTFGGGSYAYYKGLRDGKAGMWIESFDSRGGLSWPVEWFVNWGMTPLPRDALAVTNLLARGFAISAQTAHPQVCWQWIDFLSRQMNWRLVPARKSLVESPAFAQQVGEDVAAVARASMENVAVIYPTYYSPEFGEAIESIFHEAVDKIVKGEATSQEAMDWAQREAEKLVP